MIHAFRRSAYLFLSGLMGLLIFFILHRIVVFFYLFFMTAGQAEFNYYKFLIWDYSTLVFVLIFGAWYGLWIGKYWYHAVYKENIHGGLIDSVNNWLWGDVSPKKEEYVEKIEQVSHKLEENLLELEKLAKKPPVILEIKPKRAARTTKLATKKAPLKKARKTKKV